MKTSLISIIIPVYNGVSFIEYALLNIRKQECNSPLEIIFVDNNSTDGSLVLLKEIERKHPDVYVYVETKKGAGAARNKGFLKSNGDFIYFYDVDDILYKDTLSTLYSALVKYPKAKAAFGKMQKIKVGQSKKNLNISDSYTINFYNPPFWGLRWHKDLKTVVGPPAFMYRREVFDEIGLYEEALLTGQDTALDIKLGFLANIAKIDKYIYLYLKHDSSTTDILKKKKSREFMQWPRFIKSHLPFYLSGNANKEFGKILFRKIFSSMGKMICEKKTYQQRKNVFKQLCQDIQPLKTPSLLKSVLKILVVLPQGHLLKFYLYYLVPAESKKI